MAELASYLAKITARYQGTKEEKDVADLLFNDHLSVPMGDQRLNNIAALTYNSQQCDRIFNLLEKALDPLEYPWKTLHKAVLLLHTIVLFGSERAIDKAIELYRYVDKLQTYNSALVQRTSLFSTGGTDYGAPVRQAAQALAPILYTDDDIRAARSKARGGEDILVPMGDFYVEQRYEAPVLTFGQGYEKSVGAGRGIEHIPGMYENRPERYFDNVNDIRRAPVQTGDHQFTREAMNKESLLDLVFDNDSSYIPNLPEPEYLPALEKQRELERLLAQQQEQLQKLLAMQQQGGMHLMGSPPQSTQSPPAVHVSPPAASMQPTYAQQYVPTSQPPALSMPAAAPPLQPYPNMQYMQQPQYAQQAYSQQFQHQQPYTQHPQYQHQPQYQQPHFSQQQQQPPGAPYGYR